jgi:hypothetical protein
MLVFVSHLEFQNRSHFICGEPGWEEVAASVHRWREQQPIEALATHRAASRVGMDAAD